MFTDLMVLDAALLEHRQQPTRLPASMLPSNQSDVRLAAVE
jgi:hypothetical protein